MAEQHPQFSTYVYRLVSQVPKGKVVNTPAMMFAFMALSVLSLSRPVIVLTSLIALGPILGLIHGLLITRARMQPFIVTLCGLLIYRGMARYIANDETKGFSQLSTFSTMKDFFMGNVMGVPVALWLMIFIGAVMWVLLHRSVYGRHLFAVGSNENASRYAGIDTATVTIWAYVLSGLLATISGALFVFYTSSVAPSDHAQSYELYGIAAAVLGGCSLRGGSGSLVGILLGAALLRVLQNLMIFMKIPSSLEFAIIGTVILIGVLADQLLQSRGRARA